ncbi:CDP-diacylglycerol--glycerol-3-phosphate 3-phosphatidyltransferase [Telmatospirillum sp.]|uniref:CDP-diacylglycerol--glycerol-3-phosphate 3-phosphatidyltransferase n=1 Tax=Telmatospirillum sp. TaxID=2079197 RepID=UPI00284AC0D3|nr:CDP-diacylglycerol--glycerol-3-phosphate 3-phosphatidyltransferase [Telmatospirillum sp.]MDR3438465.1 CDP-diacylglycerol--glycerol-3-phosphate 3-phosphatidyltransferase [Telmatospirillum sp.]
MTISLPNLLTISRILAIPLIVVTFYIDGNTARWVGCVLFVLAAITDFFDGYFARRSNSVSSLGRFLDPIADKLLVSAVLLMLTAFDRLSLFSILPALIILLREIMVSGLREYLAELRIGMPVSRLAKWKTGIQMTALPTLMVGSAAPSWLPAEIVGEILLWGAAALTLVTGWDYLRAGLKHMQGNAP